MASSNKKKKEDGNSAVEWVSDNLRYFELIAIVVVLIVVVFFVFRAVAGNGFFGSASSSASSTAEAAVSGSDTIVAQSEGTKTVTAASETAVVTATPAPTEEPAAEEETEAEAEDKKEEEEVPEVEAPEIPEGASMDYTDGDVLTAATNYLNGLVESGASEGVESYNWINTYTYPGYADGEFVALACYHYKYADYEDYIPGLTALYLVPGEDGTLTATEDLSPEQLAYLKSVASTDEVQELIANIGAQYDSVLESNPELAAFINGGE